MGRTGRIVYAIRNHLLAMTFAQNLPNLTSDVELYFHEFDSPDHQVDATNYAANHS